MFRNRGYGQGPTESRFEQARLWRAAPHQANFYGRKAMDTHRFFLAFSVIIFCSSLALAQGRPTPAPPLPLSQKAAGEDRGAKPAESPTSSESSANPMSDTELLVPGDSPALSGPAAGPKQLFSPFVAQRLYEIACELTDSENVTESQAEQAIVFLTAALNLDSDADYCVPVLIKCACRYTQTDNSALVSRLLADYIDESADRQTVMDAVRYLLDRLDSREQREKLLENMLRNFANKNFVIGSEISTLLGQLMAEKPDVEGAQFYLAQAYANNLYNRVAFGKLAELASEKLIPALYLRHLRLMLRENLSDIQAAVGFAEYIERLELYEMAAGAYEYCANLFAYLYPSDPIPPDIYLPWAISCYNSQASQHKCMEIADAIRRSGQFDLLLEAVAGKAAIKAGDAEQATKIFQAAERKALQLVAAGPEHLKQRTGDAGDESSPKVGAKELAWFYCFALPDTAKALDWANKAYSIEPNSPVTASILAYALVMNDQTEYAKPLINAFERNQIADLTFAVIQLKEGQKDPAIQTLKALIAKDPGSFAAEQAKDILARQGTEYAPPVDPNVVLTTMEKNFGQTFIPVFVPPDKLISVQFNARGNKFSYGSSFDATVSIINNSSDLLVISDDGLFKGNIRIDADVTGDLTKKIPNLVSHKIRNTHLLEPGRSILVPVRLVTGDLRDLLFFHPQASLDIEFTLYLDPVVGSEGNVVNRLANVMPIKMAVKRPRIELTGKYLRNRFNSISTGQVGQKIKTAELFIGLLMEQQAMSGRKPLYKFVYADWMPGMLKSALVHQSGLLLNPADGEWVVKVHTMADMLDLPLDHDLDSVVAKNLNNDSWPVRMMAIYLLAKNQQAGFNKVLDWAAKSDQHALVRNMAVALGGITSQQQEQPLLQPPTVEKAPAPDKMLK